LKNLRPLCGSPTRLGSGGNGKTTALRNVAGLVRARTGQIRLDGIDITKWSPSAIVRAGLSLVPEHRQLFPEMTVEEKLIMGAYVHGLTWKAKRTLSEIYDLFPELVPKRNDSVVVLSGGQQQMLAIGRALMAKPRMLMLDKERLGLAPKLIDRIVRTIVTIHRAGVGQPGAGFLSWRVVKARPA
jgi:branched-chain amino acid transport system ATP-binding protein